MADNKSKQVGVFSEAEKAAMRSRSKELAAEAKNAKTREQGEKDIQDAISKMSEPDKSKAKRFVEIVNKTAPKLTAKNFLM